MEVLSHPNLHEVLLVSPDFYMYTCVKYHLYLNILLLPQAMYGYDYLREKLPQLTF